MESKDIYEKYVEIFSEAVRAFPANAEGLRESIMFSLWRIYEMGYEDGLLTGRDSE